MDLSIPSKDSSRRSKIADRGLLRDCVRGAGVAKYALASARNFVSASFAQFDVSMQVFPHPEWRIS